MTADEVYVDPSALARLYIHEAGSREMSAWLWHCLAVVFGSLDPELNGVFGIFEGGLPRCTMSHAAGKFGHIHHAG